MSEKNEYSPTFSIRIKKTLLSWLKKSAKKQNRKTNNYIECALEEHKKAKELEGNE